LAHGADASTRALDQIRRFAVAHFLAVAPPCDRVAQLTAQAAVLDRQGGGDTHVRVRPQSAFVENRLGGVEQCVERAPGGGFRGAGIEPEPRRLRRALGLGEQLVGSRFQSTRTDTTLRVAPLC
jgi:hypothetical protein